jgi:hypothetical protein
MLILHVWRLLRRVARQRARRRKAADTFVRLDRRTLADLGIGPEAIVSLAGEIGVRRLRRPPHL